MSAPTMTTRQVWHPRRPLVLGRITRATGNDRERFSYQPLDDLPPVIYGWESYRHGDAGWCETWSDARWWVLHCALLKD